MTASVLVADDEALLRTAFAALIEAEEDLRVAGEAADGKQAVELAARLSPDVVLMDVRMPVMDGIEATRLITQTPCPPRVLILTTFDLDKYVFEALRAGASGFALKSRPLDELLSAVRVVAEGEALLAPSVTRRLIAHFSRASKGPAGSSRDLTRLTEREREVLSLVARGLSNAELAATLHVSLPTVKTHVSRILTSSAPGTAPSSWSSPTRPGSPRRYDPGPGRGRHRPGQVRVAEAPSFAGMTRIPFPRTTTARALVADDGWRVLPSRARPPRRPRIRGGTVHPPAARRRAWPARGRAEPTGHAGSAHQRTRAAPGWRVGGRGARAQQAVRCPGRRR